MSDGKRKKNKSSGIHLLLKIVPIVAVIAVIVFFWLIFDMKQRLEEMDYDTQNIIADNRTSISNTTNNTANNTTVDNTANTIENTVVENTVTTEQADNSNTATTSTSTNNSTTIHEEHSAPDLDNNQKVALQIFQDYWGEDSGSIYEVYTNAAGEYIVKVTSKESGDNKYFKVDINSKAVTDY